MPSKNEISFARSLHQKKFRQQNKMFITEGKKAVEELLLSGYHVDKVYALKDFAEKLSVRFREKAKGKIVSVTEKELQKISTLITAQECIAIAAIPENKIDAKQVAAMSTLALD